MEWKRSRWRLVIVGGVAIGLLLLVGLIATSISDSPRDAEPSEGGGRTAFGSTTALQTSAPQTTAAPTTGPPTSISATTQTTSSLAPVSPEVEAGPLDDSPVTRFDREAFDQAAWIVARIDGFENNHGGVVLGDVQVNPGGGSIARAQDGTIFMVFVDGGIVSWELGAASPQIVEFDGRVDSVINTQDHGVVASFGGSWFSLPNRPQVDFVYAFEDQSLIAANGLRSVVVQAVTEDEGYTVIEPGHLQLFDANGSMIRSWPIGSLASPQVHLLDFDGQRILVMRRPHEPLLLNVEYVVIDTQCSACVESFLSGPGMGSLAGPDVETAFNSFDVDDFELCSTWRDQPDIATPPNLLDDARFEFERLANASARCDLRPFQFMPEPLEHSDSYRWNLLRRLLQSTPTVTDGEWAWVSTDAAGNDASIRITGLGGPQIDLQPETGG